MADDTYYEKLDLKYPEIAIAQQDIDRCNPGVIKFSVPVLTPNLRQYPEFEMDIHQTNSNIVNKDKGAVEVSNIKIRNYISCTIPKELCALAHCTYHVLDHDKAPSFINSPYPNAAMAGEGSVLGAGIPCGGGNKFSVNGSAYLNHITGLVELCPVDEGDDYRYIRKPSRWLMMFIGGDINNPVIICRLP